MGWNKVVVIWKKKCLWNMFKTSFLSFLLIKLNSTQSNHKKYKYSEKFAKSSPYFWLALHSRTKLRWRFCKILWPSQNIWTLKTFKIFETLSSSPMPSSIDLLSINILAKASKYLSRYSKEFESDRNLEENKTPSSFSDIYVPKFWVDLIFNSNPIPNFFLFWYCKLQSCRENLEIYLCTQFQNKKKLSCNSSQHSTWAHKCHFCMSNHDGHHIELASFNQFHWIFRHKRPENILRVIY